MSLDQGTRVKPSEFKDKIWYGNYNRLQTWANIGTDVENGLWAIYGARLGCEMAVLSDWDVNLISDYDWFKSFFYDDVAPKFEGENDMKCNYTKQQWEQELLYNEVCSLGHRLNNDINEMMLFNPNEQMCRFFKKTYVNPKRWGVMIREKQIQDLLEKGLIGSS